MPEQITSWTSALQTSISNALTLLLAAIPQIVAFLLLIGIGWVIAGLVARVVTAALGRARFNDWVHRSGVGAAVGGTGVDLDAIGLVALIAKWFIRLIALVVAFDALGLPAVSDTLRQLLLWLPNLAVALVILVIGGLSASAVYGIVRTSLIAAELGQANFLAGIARAGVWMFAIVLAVYQVGIASELVTAVFTAIVAGLALAVGLAFGLGGREVAGEIVRDVYERVRASEGSHHEQSLPRAQQRSQLRREH
jgi:hypothetical protein